jgi:hypothetical protein
MDGGQFELPGRADISIHEHSALIDAMLAGEAGGAEGRMHEHPVACRAAPEAPRVAGRGRPFLDDRDGGPADAG